MRARYRYVLFKCFNAITHNQWILPFPSPHIPVNSSFINIKACAEEPRFRNRSEQLYAVVVPGDANSSSLTIVNHQSRRYSITCLSVRWMHSSTAREMKIFRKYGVVVRCIGSPLNPASIHAFAVESMIQGYRWATERVRADEESRKEWPLRLFGQFAVWIAYAIWQGVGECSSECMWNVFVILEIN